MLDHGSQLGQLLTIEQVARAEDHSLKEPRLRLHTSLPTSFEVAHAPARIGGSCH